VRREVALAVVREVGAADLVAVVGEVASMVVVVVGEVALMVVAVVGEVALVDEVVSMVAA
jgi:hypothetical protein